MQNLMRIAESHNISIEYCNLPLNESMILQDKDGDTIIIDISLVGEGANERAHLAHEIGHSVMGAFYNPYAPLDTRQKHEYKANKWAVTNCISEQELDQAVSDGYTDIYSLAEHFNVPIQFMKMAVCWYTYGNIHADLYF